MARDRNGYKQAIPVVPSMKQKTKPKGVKNNSMKTNIFTVQIADQLDKVFNTITECDNFVGFEMLSDPSKMPEKAFNIHDLKIDGKGQVVSFEQ